MTLHQRNAGFSVFQNDLDGLVVQGVFFATAIAALPAPLRALKRHFGGIIESLQVDPNAMQAAESQADFDDPIPF